MRTSLTHALADGRTLGYHEYGDPHGVPCLYTTGTPASGLAAGLYDDAAREAGVRWISIDKPGYGLSDFHPGRRLADYADDVASLADALELPTFAAAGESGGGPHVLSVARHLPDRVSVAIVLAGMGPGHERWVRDGMNRLNKVMFFMGQRAPWMLRLAMWQMGRVVSNPKKFAALNERKRKKGGPVDPRMEQIPVDFMQAALADAFRNGGRGAAQEMALFSRPWGFDLEDIRCPVELWHGSEDDAVPIAVARQVAQRIPQCRAHLIEGEGHAVGFFRRDEVMAAVVSSRGVTA